MRLTEFITDISGSTNNGTTMSFFVGDGSSVSGSGNIAGNITGSDGSSGTYSCNFRNEAINQVDDSGFLKIQNQQGLWFTRIDISRWCNLYFNFIICLI